LRDFLGRYAHNLPVMANDLKELLTWVTRRSRGGQKAGDLSRVTLGQLVVLLELFQAGSVADCADARGEASEDVNRRQKLARLQEGLGLGELTRLVGNRTRLTSQGEQVSNEFRLFLNGIQTMEGDQSRVLRIAAGDTWVQSFVLPAIWDIESEPKGVRWSVINLDDDGIAEGFANGDLDFGLVRRVARKSSWAARSEPLGSWEIGAYRLLVGAEVGGLSAMDGTQALRELIREKVPWIQHSRTLERVAKACTSILRRPLKTEPHVLCDTHLQAALSVCHRRGWCVVPDHIEKVLYRPVSKTSPSASGFRSFSLPRVGDPDELELIANRRLLEQQPAVARMAALLKRALGRQFR
jgi:DNA-binding transcriptional LysR family regulator